MSSKLVERLTGVRDSVIESELMAIEQTETFVDDRVQQTPKKKKKKTQEEMIAEAIDSSDDWDNRWLEYMSNESAKSGGRSRIKRHTRRLLDGRAVKPCGRECHTWGFTIIETRNHSSMVNSEYLVDDKEFLIMAAMVTPSPKSCINFFYNYINPYLKKDKKFRLEFLKSLYKNKNILLRRDIEWFVKQYGFQEENNIIIKDKNFKQELIEYFNELKDDIPAYLTRWENIQEKREHKRYIKTITEANNKMQDNINDLLTIFDTEKKDNFEDWAELIIK